VIEFYLLRRAKFYINYNYKNHVWKQCMTMSVEENVRVLVKAVAERFAAEKIKLATAESCTGGWISQLVTSLPGSSAWFDAGFVTYSNNAKQEMLDVPASLFAEAGPGAVSEECVLAMCAGALAHSSADIALASSGIAGPDGGTPEKPVGTVWLAWARRGGTQRAVLHHFEGDRYSVRLATVEQALKGLVALIDNTQPPRKRRTKEK
jgi:nicotinamide-nucleotide amidase